MVEVYFCLRSVYWTPDITKWVTDSSISDIRYATILYIDSDNFSQEIFYYVYIYCMEYKFSTIRTNAAPLHIY